MQTGAYEAKIQNPTQRDTSGQSKPPSCFEIESWPSAIVESSSDAVIARSLDNFILYWNAGATRILGYTAEEAIGRPLSLVVPSEFGDEDNQIVELARDGGYIEYFETIRLHKDGTRIAVELSVSKISDVTGNLIGISEIARTIGDRTKGQPVSHPLQEKPESSRNGTEQLDKLEGEFTASVSHELRTPLHTIIGFADLLAEEGHGPLNEKQRGFLSHIHTDSQHLLNLINDVLDFSRSEAGGSDLNPEVLSLRSLVSESLDAMNVYASRRNVSLRQGEIADIAVLSDDMCLRKILSSLLNNGVKFTQSGGEVSVETVEQGDFVRITVSDTGIGIPAIEYSRIFDKFYQFGFTTLGVREGTGLGLASCRQLVEMQGGKIWVESEPGHGSHFHFTMPRAVR